MSRPAPARGLQLPPGRKPPAGPIAFIIGRLSYYRNLGPVIEEALARGIPVEAWHDVGQATTGMKGADFPALDGVPRFRNGTPKVFGYNGRAGLRERLTSTKVRVVVALQAPFELVGATVEGPPWVTLQRLGDSFVIHSPASLATSTALAPSTSWWVDWGANYHRHLGGDGKGSELEMGIRARSTPIGMPELDPCGQLDAAEARRRWKIPAGRPVVLLLPFPAGSTGTLWNSAIYPEGNRLTQLGRVLRRGRLDLLPHVIHGWNDVRLVAALRRFCDRNGAFLVAKSRRKFPTPSHIHKQADLCLYDESFYPPTMLEALSVSSLCVNFYSTAVVEAAASRVPNLCLSFGIEDFYDGDATMMRTSILPSLNGIGGPFDFPGVSTSWTIPEAIGRLPESTFRDFPLDERAREAYLKKFAGPMDGKSSARAIDLAQGLVGTRR